MDDWTMDASGCSNSSKAFELAVDAVAEILVSHRLGTDVEATARLIVAKLAHKHRLAPQPHSPFPANMEIREGDTPTRTTDG